ncbi:hypothetical protein ECANGB1_2354 [Enterospora canceri]|uniref:UBX domain-containing protein n=1 Tax=Enterospora canceri TaxID=1081671 RepID=A0A1Y1S8P0_9MICR|nr:hypothetical protein ECANGB1_2354 [Enterospora canceri]
MDLSLKITPMVKSSLKQSEAIDLLLEAGLDETEIRDALAEIGDPTPENVYGHLQKLKKAEETEKARKEEATADANKKHKDMLKKQAEQKEMQLKRVKDKIKAAQDENRKKEDEFDKETQKGYEDVIIEEYYKVRVFLPTYRSMFIGLDDGATAKDLFARIREENKKLEGKLGNFSLSKYGLRESVNEDDTPLLDVFGHTTCMLILEETSTK